ncbi:MAG TPA: GNAT family N-acetyltransferase [Candidatus Merdivicinus faecavium]|nr:GNAT family N-acetyltransferase [Candidatus Merdivicinus faecavium]
MKIRPARAEDAAAVGKIYCDSWKAAYRGIMPADYLVLESEEGAVFGLANIGASRDQERPDWGELRAIYLLPEYWRKGSGTALFRAAEEELRRRGYGRYFLWVLVENTRARRFYEKMGMRLSGPEQPFSIGGKEIWECRYERELL